MDLNRKVNSILALLLIIIALLGLGGYVFFRTEGMPLAENNLNLTNISAKKETKKPELKKDSGMDERTLKSCLNRGASLVAYNENRYGIAVLEMMDWELYKELYCLGGGFIYKHAVARWGDSLIYTYLESEEKECFGYDCPADSLIRKVETFNLETGEKDILWSGKFEWEDERGLNKRADIAVKHFYLIEDYLYLTLGSDCSEGCSGAWNTGISFKLDLNNLEEMKYVPLEGKLIAYEGDYYEYQSFSDIGGGGVNYFEKYDVENDEIISQYNINESLWAMRGNKEMLDGDEYWGAELMLLGFSNGNAVFRETMFDEEKSSKFLPLILDLKTGDVEEIDTVPNLEVSLLGDPSLPYRDSFDFSPMLKGFEDKYEITPIYLK